MPRIWKRLLLFALGAAICVLVYLFLLNFPPVGRNSPTAGIIPVLFLAAGTGWLTARFLRVDALSPAVLGLTARDRPVVRLGVGFLAGSALTGLWLVIVTIATDATWHPNPTFGGLALLSACAFNFLNNVGEEFVYRGYAFVRLADHWGAALAVLLTSGAFALLHLQAGLPWLSVLAGVLTAGLVFGAIFAHWRSLPLALGFHVATNIVQDASGLRTSAASLWVPEYPAAAAAAGPTVLAGIAVLNLVLAVSILLLARRQPTALARPN